MLKKRGNARESKVYPTRGTADQALIAFIFLKRGFDMFKNRLSQVMLVVLLIAVLFLLIVGCESDQSTKADETALENDDKEVMEDEPDKGPFLKKTETVLFEGDIRDGTALGWNLDPGWDVISENGEHFLEGKGHGFARPQADGWSNYTVIFKFKLLEDSIHINFRETLTAGHIRYFAALHQGGLSLEKQITTDFFNLVEARMPVDLNRWYDFKAVLDENNIKIYLDEALVIDYMDQDMPINMGIFSLETHDNTVVHVSDVRVNGTKMVQRAEWEKKGGPSGGLGYDVRIQPDNKNTMFVTDDPSGVNKSYDGGETWVQRNDGITTRSGASGDGIPVFCLTIDSGNPHIIWAGMQGMRGIFKSKDNGETWQKKDNGIIEWDEITFRGFGIHPYNSDIVLAGAEIATGIMGEYFEKVEGKIYKTEDGGDNWHPVWEGGSLARTIIFDPNNPDIVYASTGIFDREAYNETGTGVLKSTDGGNSWKEINNGFENLFIGFLEMHPDNPEILFAAVGNHTHSEGNGIYRTTDGGASWIKVLPSASSTDYEDSIRMTVVTISPSDPNIVYAGDGETGFYRSNDGGDSWTRHGGREGGGYGPEGVRAGIPISAVVHPHDSKTVFINNYNGGVIKSTDGGRTWANCSTGYTGADLRGIVQDSTNPDNVFVIGRSGPFRSHDGGYTWEGMAYEPANFPEWYTIAINPGNQQELLISDEFDGHLVKSTDGGKNWRIVYRHTFAGDLGHGFKTIAYAPSDPDIVYAGMRAELRVIHGDFPPRPSFGIYRSEDGGLSWKEANGGLEETGKNINAIAVHPDNHDIVYAATWQDGIYKTTDGGRNWFTVNNGLYSLDVRSLTIDPSNPEIIYAGLGEGVGIFKSINGGELWEPVNLGISVFCPSFLLRVGEVQPGFSLEIPKRFFSSEYYSIPWSSIESIVIDPLDSKRLFAADQNQGVYLSEDGGQSWFPINAGLSMRAVSALSLSGNGRVLYAATSGGGVYKLEF